jgi:hypothetical protein
MKWGEVTSVGSAAHDIQDKLEGVKEAFKHSLPGRLCYHTGIGDWDQVGDGTKDLGDSRAREAPVSDVKSALDSGEAMKRTHLANPPTRLK